MGASALATRVFKLSSTTEECTDVAYAPVRRPERPITDLECRGSDVLVKFRVEHFVADPAFPNVSDRGLIYVQLDDRSATYLGTHTRPEDDVVVGYVKPQTR